MKGQVETIRLTGSLGQLAGSRREATLFFVGRIHGGGGGGGGLGGQDLHAIKLQKRRENLWVNATHFIT